MWYFLRKKSCEMELCDMKESLPKTEIEDRRINSQSFDRDRRTDK